jgi:hypothetical protein
VTHDSSPQTWLVVEIEGIHHGSVHKRSLAGLTTLEAMIASDEDVEYLRMAGHWCLGCAQVRVGHSAESSQLCWKVYFNPVRTNLLDEYFESSNQW